MHAEELEEWEFGNPVYVPGLPGETSTQIEHPWEKYLKMSVEEKRKYYECGDRYVQIRDIDTWPKFYKDNEYYFVSRIQKNTKIEPAYPFDARLNERISLWEGDITRLEIDAIVNAANKSLLGGGDVDGHIHRAAGNTLVDECRLLMGCETGNAKITSGHKLPAKWVIHTVGPIGKDEEALTSCYENCFRVALEKKVRTLAFCCVSTGIYGYPNKDAAEVALKTTREWLEDEDNANAVDRIIFCLFSDVDIKIYQTLMLKYFPPKEKTQDKSEESKPTGTNEPEKKETKPAKTEHKEKDHAEERGEGESNLKPDQGNNVDEEEKVMALQKGRKIKDNGNSKAEIPNSKKLKQEGVNADNGTEGRQDEEVVRERDQEKQKQNTKGKKDEKMQQPDKIMQEQNEKMDVGEEQNESNLKPDQGNNNEEKKKVMALQKRRKIRDDENSKAEIPISKKQKQESVNADKGTEGQQEEEVVREGAQKEEKQNYTGKKGDEKMQQQDEKMQEQNEKMDVGEELSE